MIKGTFKLGNLDVEFSYFPGSMGTMEDPPAYEEVEIVSVKLNGIEIDLSDEEYDKIENHFWDNRPPEIDEPDLDY